MAWFYAAEWPTFAPPLTDDLEFGKIDHAASSLGLPVYGKAVIPLLLRRAFGRKVDPSCERDTHAISKGDMHGIPLDRGKAGLRANS
ncbi:hypothetical protein OSJ57_16930 [Sphingomonas sp. HH69]